MLEGFKSRWALNIEKEQEENDDDEHAHIQKTNTHVHKEEKKEKKKKTTIIIKEIEIFAFVDGKVSFEYTIFTHEHVINQHAYKHIYICTHACA